MKTVMQDIPEYLKYHDNPVYTLICINSDLN